MTQTSAQFFDGLLPHLRAAQFKPNAPGTDTGMNVYSYQKGRRNAVVTVNHVPGENYVSVKLTVNRGTSGPATPVFDRIHAKFKLDEDKLRSTDGVYWTWAPSAKESKVQARRPIGAARPAFLYKWVVDNARVLRSWAEWSKSV